MVVYSVTVKWGKEKFKDVELDTGEPGEVFKAQLYALTNVLPERQKVMIKGGILKESWDTVKGLKNGATILMMGSAEALPEAPKEKTQFMEDLSEAEQNKAIDLPPGIVNLGNTCYLNSVLQCLRTIPELNSALETLDKKNTEPLLSSIAALWEQMNKSGEAANPILLLTFLHNQFPQFAEKDEKGQLRQQDANEAWLAIMRYLQLLKGKGESNGKDLITQLMSIQMESRIECLEDGAEKEINTKKEETLQINCFIDQNVKYVITGIKSNLTEIIEKESSTLQRNAKFQKTSKAVRLPKYLALNFIRFFYKQDKNVSAKILKEVKFPEHLDLWDICSDELREKLRPMRNKLKESEDKEMEMKAKLKKIGEKNKDVTIKHEKYESTEFPDDLGSNNCGWYELKAVLTHQGRSSSAGHYIAWTVKDGKWSKMDDDKPSSVNLDEVLKLCGGGDWHTAYICLYGPRAIPIIEELPVEEQGENGSGEMEQ